MKKECERKMRRYEVGKAGQKTAIKAKRRGRRSSRANSKFDESSFEIWNEPNDIYKKNNKFVEQRSV
jgi:hypothetical protein